MNYCLAQTNWRTQWTWVCVGLKHWNTETPSIVVRAGDLMRPPAVRFLLTDTDMLRLYASLCLNSTFLWVQCCGNGLIMLWLGWGIKPKWLEKQKKKPIMFWLKQISTPVVSKPSRKLYGCPLMIVETLECCFLHLAAVSPICCAMRWTYYDLCCADVTEMKLIGCWLKWSADNVKCRHFILATGLKIWWWWKYETLASSGSKPHFSWGTCPVIGQAVAGYTWISNLVASYQLHRG